MTEIELAALRRDYSQQRLDEKNINPDPIQQFQTWFREALHAQIPEPNAMILATADLAAMPTLRTVLLKGISAGGGFEFYTNFNSRKGRNLSENPQATLLFLWLELERQVTIEGRVEVVEAATADAYFASRPRGSQIGAWVSPQSQVIAHRQWLEDRMQEMEYQFVGLQTIPRPDFWGGFRVMPHRFEFWQGRPNRLHDRIEYRACGNEHWQMNRLAP